MNPVIALSMGGERSRGEVKQVLTRKLIAIWQVLERAGQRRAAAEMTRQAAHFRLIDPERAVFFERVAADCRRASIRA